MGNKISNHKQITASFDCKRPLQQMCMHTQSQPAPPPRSLLQNFNHVLHALKAVCPQPHHVGKLARLAVIWIEDMIIMWSNPWPYNASWPSQHPNMQELMEVSKDKRCMAAQCLSIILAAQMVETGIDPVVDRCWTLTQD